MTSQLPPHTLSWGLSLLLHSGLALVVLLLPADATERPPLEPFELTDRQLPPDRPPEPDPPEPPEPPAPQPKVAMVSKPPPREAPVPPEATREPPAEPPPAEPVQPPTFGIELEGTARAPAGTGVQVPPGETLLAKPTRRPQKKRPERSGPTPSRGFKTEFKAGESAPLAVVTSMPKVQKQVIAEYPEQAKELGIEGRVKLQLSINGQGQVVSATVIQSLHPLLDAAAKIAALKMRFTPATVNGTPVTIQIPYTFTFVLD